MRVNIKKKLIILIIVMFVLNIGSLAWSETKDNIKINPEAAKYLLNKPCPKGWHKVPSDPNFLICKPNKPKPIECPPGTVYVDKSQTQCFVGCQPVPH